MSLVPIIYTSLLIFSAFLLFVIIVSYISYKSKSGNRVPPHLRNHVDPFGNGLALQTVAAANLKVVKKSAASSIAPVQSIIRPPKAEVAQRSEENYNRAVQTMKQMNKKTTILKDAYEKNENVKREESNKTTKNFRSTRLSNRLEIMNESEKFRTSIQEENRSFRKENTYSSHADLNIISFYSDKSDLDYAAFSTPRISRAM